MKGKLITNGVLSLLSMIGLILMVLFFMKTANAINNGEDSEVVAERFLKMLLLGSALLGIFGIASLVMGIVTLATMGENKSGLVIASGILCILGGALGINAIVSFIAASKVS